MVAAYVFVGLFLSYSTASPLPSVESDVVPVQTTEALLKTNDDVPVASPVESNKYEEKSPLPSINGTDILFKANGDIVVLNGTQVIHAGKDYTPAFNGSDIILKSNGDVLVVNGTEIILSNGTRLNVTAGENVELSERFLSDIWRVGERLFQGVVDTAGAAYNGGKKVVKEIGDIWNEKEQQVQRFVKETGDKYNEIKKVLTSNPSSGPPRPVSLPKSRPKPTLPSGRKNQKVSQGKKVSGKKTPPTNTKKNTPVKNANRNSNAKKPVPNRRKG